jgi:hypothetical protein
MILHIAYHRQCLLIEQRTSYGRAQPPDAPYRETSKNDCFALATPSFVLANGTRSVAQSCSPSNKDIIYNKGVP